MSFFHFNHRLDGKTRRFSFRLSGWVLMICWHPYGMIWHFPWAIIADHIQYGYPLRLWGRAHDSESLWWCFLGVEWWKMLEDES